MLSTHVRILDELSEFFDFNYIRQSKDGEVLVFKEKYGFKLEVHFLSPDYCPTHYYDLIFTNGKTGIKYEMPPFEQSYYTLDKENFQKKIKTILRDLKIEIIEKI